MRWRGFVRDPVVATSLSLAGGSVAASAIGFLFWWVASHRAAAAEIGIASSLIGAVGLVAMLGRLGLDVGYLKFAPTSGDPVRLLGHSLTLAALATLGLALLVAAGAALVSPALASALRHPLTLLAFILAAVSTALVSVLAGGFLAADGHRSVLLQTVGVSVLRVGLLLPFAVVQGGDILLCWALASVAVVAFGALWTMPRLREGARLVPGLRAVRDTAGFLRFSMWNGLVVLSEATAGLVLPLVVLESLGAEPAGRFYITLMLANVAWIVPTAAATAFLARGARHPGRMAEELARIRAIAVALLAAGVVGAWVGGRFVLGLFGTGSDEEGRILLTLLVASAIPLAVLRLAGARFRLLDQTRALLAANAAATFLGIALPLLATPRFGLVGLGVAWLVAQGSVALAVLAYARRAGAQRAG